MTEFFGRNRNGSVKSLLLPDLLGTVISHILIEMPQMVENNPKNKSHRNANISAPTPCVASSTPGPPPSYPNNLT